MQIIFSCLGFSTAEVFAKKDGRLWEIGWITRRVNQEEFELFEGGLWEGYIKREELPKPEEIVLQYQNELKLRGIVAHNPEVVYAG